MSQLQELKVDDFTGGLNTQGTQFTLAQNESPSMLNIEIDDRKGFRTRKGWARWNAADILDPSSVTWAPRNTHTHPLSNGGYVIYLANDGDTYGATSSGVFSDLTIPNGASPHLADFASWGDTCYFACGKGLLPYKRVGTSAAAALSDASDSNFNDDYTTPVNGCGMVAEVCEAHVGYMFAAHTREGGSESSGVVTGGTVYPNRLRWSHPSKPEDWATLDYIDIEIGGGMITALMSFQDHLLIFKTDSVWALYGYDSDSWQLIQVADSVGALSPEAVTRSESAVYFYSASDQGGVYAYVGQSPVLLSGHIERITDDISAPVDAWVSWVAGRLWCSLPWLPDGTWADGDSVCAVFDPALGNGAWTLHTPAIGSVQSIVDGSDLGSNRPLAVLGGDWACLVRLETRTQAADLIDDDGVTATPFEAYYVTRWYNAGTQELRKSWRRSRFIATREDASVVIKVYTYRDYNEKASVRSHTINVDSSAAAVWGAFNWGAGPLWGGSAAEGSDLKRPQPPGPGLGGHGVARSIQLRFESDATTLGNPWGLSAMSLKYHQRRFTT